MLFLGADDYVGWELRGASVFSPDRIAAGLLCLPPKETSYWTRYDFDSMTPSELDLADFVISARSPLMSQPPPNFERVAVTESFELWQRTGPTPPRRTLPRRTSCRVKSCAAAPRAGGASGQEPGVAHVWSSTPVHGRKGDWLASSGRPPAKGFRRPTALVPGRALIQTLELGRGRWEISLQYHSADPLRVRGPGLDVSLPPNAQRVGSFWRVGTISLPKTGDRDPQGRDRSRARSCVTCWPAPTGWTPGTAGLIVGVAATRVGAPRATVPLRLACGRFVDWYRQS